MRILIVEDDPRIHEAVAGDLRRQRHVVDVLEDGEAGLDYARSGVYDVILLDIMLPGIDGLELCRRLRAEKSTAFILMITARDGVDDKVGALDTGADDYLVKPFELAELSARIRAVARRKEEPRGPILEHGELSLDPALRRVTNGGATVGLTPTEYAIFETLMRSPLQIFSRDLLLEKVTTFESSAGAESIKTHITNIRRKIRAAGGGRDPIESVYGVGYRLADLA
ncbi:MAG: response regulator transcription factor [Vulcanimicrobiaceae bacterium]